MRQQRHPCSTRSIAAFTGPILLQGRTARGSCQEKCAIKHTLLIFSVLGHKDPGTVHTSTDSSSTPGHCTELGITTGGMSGTCCCMFLIRST